MDVKSQKDTMWWRKKELEVEIQTEKVGKKIKKKKKDLKNA